MSRESLSRRAGLKLSLLSGFVLLLLLAFVAFKFKIADDGLDSMVYKLAKEEELLSRMRINLLKSVDVEKGAVMAVTDELSRTLAEQSKQAADAVERDRMEFSRIIGQGDGGKEAELLREFDGCWADMRKLDKQILEYAVENTNVKASTLSFTKGSQALERFEQSLMTIGRSMSPSIQCNQVQTLAWEAVTAAFKVYCLHAPHIAASDAAEMDRIEKEIRHYNDLATGSLKELESLVPAASRASLRDADAAFADFQAITAEVIALSRQNTNIKSFELSIGRKRKVSAQCDDILASMQATVRSKSFEATK